MVYFPILIGEMAKKEIKKKNVAKILGICEKAFINKLQGKTPFTWPEAKKIRNTFFPDAKMEDLFYSPYDIQDSA